jgi:hypothetical protein
MSRIGLIRRQVSNNHIYIKMETRHHRAGDCFGPISAVVQHQDDAIRGPRLFVQRDQARPNPFRLIPNWNRNNSASVIHG